MSSRDSDLGVRITLTIPQAQMLYAVFHRIGGDPSRREQQRVITVFRGAVDIGAAFDEQLRCRGAAFGYRPHQNGLALPGFGRIDVGAPVEQ